MPTKSKKKKLIRVSDYFNLKLKQPSLDFVDVDISSDVPVFIEPRALTLENNNWADESVHLLQNYFETVMRAVASGKFPEVYRLLSQLHEPWETHLGLSKGSVRGRAMGPEFNKKFANALASSQAAKSGLLRDLEDTALMIPGIYTDRISDITTNVIRGPLIRYTIDMCNHYGIPLHQNIASKPQWDPKKRNWFTSFISAPMANGKPLMLVPKIITRRHCDFSPDAYYNHYILEHLRQVELAKNSSLVEVLRDKKGNVKGRRVTKKRLKEEYGKGKEAITRETLNYPHLLDQYRKDNEQPSAPLTHEGFEEPLKQEPVDWDGLLRDLLKIKPGKPDAYKYERAVEALVAALFYPSLCHPVKQTKMFNGRKVIDITYANNGDDSFFGWLRKNHPASHIVIECKNYTGDVGNPELDQICGRLSPSSGMIGLLYCRQLSDKAGFVDICRRTAASKRHYILPLDDNDMKDLIRARKVGTIESIAIILQEKFREIAY